MFKLNLKIALRNLWKYKGYTLINVLGLSVSLAGCLLIFIFSDYELSFDKDYENGDRIYRVTSSWTPPDGEFFSQGVPKPLAAAARQDISQFERVAAIRAAGTIVKVAATTQRPELKNIETVYYTEPQFFDIFKINWIYGKPYEALTAPFNIALSEETAIKYFGSWKNAVGKSIKLDGKTDYKVTGIYKDFPSNSSFPLKFVLSYASFDERDSKDWGTVSSNQECYVLLKNGVKAEDLTQQLTNFVKKYYTDRDMQDLAQEHHALQALSEIHHDDRFGNFAGKRMSKSELLGLGIIGLFLLITASINFINLATAQAVSRSKEVGIRKVMGSMRKQLIGQFLSETTLITLFALLLACIITELALPGMGNLFGEAVVYSLFGHPQIYLFMLLLIITVSFLAGLYPAIVMSGFSPALAIKNKVSAANAGGVGLRKALVVLQFGITTVLIIGTLMVVKQMDYMQQKSLGFDPTSVAVVDIPSDSLSQLRYENLKTAIVALPGVKNVSFCYAPPSADNNNESSFKINSSKRGDFQVNTKVSDDQYIKTFGMKLIAGRNISKSDTTKEYIINETFLKKLNIKDPDDALGKIMTIHDHPGPVVGVVKDFNNYSLHESISPVAIFSSKDSYNVLAIKMETGSIKDIMKVVEKETNKAFPEYVYSAGFFDEAITQYYEIERVMGILFKVFSGVVIFISFIGLFGLISFVATQRTKEIAIRKVLGASNLELIKMLNSSFLWMVLIANLLAWPVAYIFVSRWLSGFAYSTPLSIWPFVFAMVLSIIITLITVSLRSYRAAKTNPIDALKYE